MKKVIAFIMILALGLVASACATPEANNTTTSPNTTQGTSAPAVTDVPAVTAEPKELYEFTIFMPDASDDFSNDRVVQYLEDMFNLDMTFTGVAWNDATTQLRMLVTGGDMPDYCVSQQAPGSTDFTAWIEDGLIIELTDYINAYPNLTAYVNSNETFDGYLSGDSRDKWYCIPRYYDGIVPHSVMIRMDWLEELNLEVPTNYDELYTVLKAVVAADPDGMGTIGYSHDHVWWLSHDIINFTGSYDWSLQDDGQYEQYFALDSYRECMKYFNKLYEEGLYDPDFVLGQAGMAQEKFMSGQTFMIYGNADSSIFGVTYDGLMDNFPDAELAIIEPMEGPAGQYTYANASDVACVDIISSNCEKPERVIELLDYLASEEGQTLTLYGIEGIHYTVGSDGSIIKNDAEYEADTNAVPLSWSNVMNLANMILEYGYTRTFSEEMDNYDILYPAYEMRHSLKPARPLDTYQFTSTNAVDYMPNVYDVANTWEIEFITGEKDADTDWDTYLTALNDAHYDLIKADLKDWMDAHAK